MQLDTISFRLIIFTNAFFANNLNLSSQISYVICLANAFNRANIIHRSSTKCKQVTRSVLALELYAMVYRFDSKAMIKSTVEKILLTSVPMIVCTDSKSLYNCFLKLDHTQEKRLMIDVMCLWQTYERHEIMGVKWIDRESNPTDVITKTNPCVALW